jgi:hypothetical protein
MAAEAHTDFDPRVKVEGGVLAKARNLFPNQGMHRNAAFIAGLHPRAIDYLQQAPVLAAAFGVKANTRADRLFIAMRMGGPIERGERLRSVMASVNIPSPLRKLSGYAISPFMSSFVRDLADLDTSTLSQCIPDKPRAQREWLASLRDYRSRIYMRGMSPRLGFAWIARHAHRCDEGQAADFADFVSRHPSVDIDRWSLERMMNEVELWHDRLAADTSLTQYGLSLKPSTLIDLSDWPQHAEVGGFEFFKLSTPYMLLEEGRRMRHCVASYIPRVVSGRCHIYSVRADMRRMATLEVVGTRVAQLKGFANKLPIKAVEAAAYQFARDGNPSKAA